MEKLRNYNRAMRILNRMDTVDELVNFWRFFGSHPGWVPDEERVENWWIVLS